MLSVSLGIGFSEGLSFEDSILNNKSPLETLSPTLIFTDSTLPVTIDGRYTDVTCHESESESESEFHWNVTDLPDTGYNLRAPSALSERLRRFSAHVTSSAALTSLTRSAWPFRPSIPPLVHLPARASPPAHSNTLPSHTWLVVAAFLRRRQPSSPRITARRSRATHSPSPNRPPTKFHPPGPVSPRRAAYAVPPRRGAVWEGPGQSPIGGAGLPTCPVKETRIAPRYHARTLLP